MIFKFDRYGAGEHLIATLPTYHRLINSEKISILSILQSWSSVIPTLNVTSCPEAISA